MEDPSEVLDAAARFLEARQRSVAEVRRKLVGLGYQSALVEQVLARLEELRYLDDESFARAWVDSRDRAHPRGEYALRHELEQRGVAREIIDAVLEDRRAAPQGGEAVASADELAARRLIEKRASALRREPDPRKRRQRAYALLAKAGFAPDLCSSISRLVVDPAGGDDDDGPGDLEGMP